MKWSTITTVFVLFVASLLFMRSEGFTSPGTLVQLNSSHVPTEDDFLYGRFMYPQIVREEITRMTGEDPGAKYPGRRSTPFYVTL